MLTDLSMFVTFTFIISQKKKKKNGKENTNFFLIFTYFGGAKFSYRKLLESRSI